VVKFKETVRRFATLVKPQQGRFWFLLSIILFTEATYTSEKYLFKVMIDDGTKYAAHTMAQQSFTIAMLWVAAIFFSIVIVRIWLKYMSHHLISMLECDLIANLKRKFFNHIIRLSYGFHTTHKTGSLISRMTRGSRAVESMMDAIVFNAAPIVFQLVVTSIALSSVSLPAMGVIIGTVVLFVAYSVRIQLKLTPFRLVANDQEDVEKGTMADFFTNVDSIKHFGKEQNATDKFYTLTEHTKIAFKKQWDFYAEMDAGQTLIIGIGTLLTITLPLRAFIAGEITLGSIVFIYTIFIGFIGSMYGLVHGIRRFYESTADFESLYSYESITNDIVDKKNAPQLQIKQGTVEFRNVTFAYDQQPIFKDFKLKVGKKQKIALVGHSGSGKSTLVKLLYRLYDVESGAILIDGKDIKGFDQESLRSELSIVPQECVLFDDTIYNNILFSRPDATRAQVQQAIKFAQLDKTIAKFPKQENTIVGERGVKLSGGEKQRVSIARALLADRKILVLDEATSALDSQTEHDIQKDLEELMKNRTTIIIAHRLSTIMRADKIVVLEHGKILQTGTHRELIKQKGKYKELWNLQKGGYLGE